MLTKADKEFLFAKFATKDDLFTRLDEIVGELRALREEVTVLAYRQSDHSDRIERLEDDVKILKKTRT